MESLYKIILITFALTLVSCKENHKSLTNPNDYSIYFELENNGQLQDYEEEKQFWENKLERNPEQFPYLAKLAAAHSQLFSLTGKLEHLKEAEKSLVKANEITEYAKVGYLRALARNYISQHRFKEALILLDRAEVNGEGLMATQKMLFDVHLELNNLKEAEQYLKNIVNMHDFDYLIRLAKWSDYKGQLDLAIGYMERATALAESSNQNGLMSWAYTNLADFYGHAGEIKASYDHYLKALALNPSDAYAKKGLVWIVYSHEHKAKEALRMLNVILKQHESPDYYLLQAEIAEYLNNKKLNAQSISTYQTLVDNADYGVMYNSYNAKLLADTDRADEALTLAKKEVENRPTAQSYDLLAWAYYKKGNVNEALRIFNTYVESNTFEPEVLYHMAKVYSELGDTQAVKRLKRELSGCGFELGPVTEAQIAKL